MEFVASQRGRIGVVLSLVLVWTFAYFLWIGGQERLTTSPTWRLPKNINNPDIVDLDRLGSIDDHFAFHTQTFIPAGPSKTVNVAAGNDENHYAIHTKTFTPVAAAAKVQPTPVQNTDGRPITSVFLDGFDETSIKEVCANMTWAPSKDIVINCEDREGDVADVKQKVLLCLRDAINIGASLMRPTVIVQSGGLAQYANGSTHPMSYMFDMDAFDARVRKSCPLLPIYENLRMLEKHGRSIWRIDRPRDLPEEDGQRMTPKNWAEKNAVGEGKITLINYPQTIGQTSVCNDDASFITNFGKIIEVRPDARLLAERALLELEKRFDLPTAASNGVIENAFVGMYLSTEADAINTGSASYEQRAAAYLEYITSTSLKVVYVASGNTDSLEPFTEAASAQLEPVHVITKWDLLQGEDSAILKSMTLDQQSLVDYLVLQKSSKFAAFPESSFSWSIAYTRQQFGDIKPCTSNSTQHMTDDGVIYEDNLSKLYGRQGEFSRDTMWP